MGSSQVNGISQVECVELEERKQRAEEPQHEMTTINWFGHIKLLTKFIYIFVQITILPPQNNNTHFILRWMLILNAHLWCVNTRLGVNVLHLQKQQTLQNILVTKVDQTLIWFMYGMSTNIIFLLYLRVYLFLISIELITKLEFYLKLFY